MTKKQLTVFITPSLTGTSSNNAKIAEPSGVTDTKPGNNSSTDTDQLMSEAGRTRHTGGAGAWGAAVCSATLTVTVTNSGPSTVTGATVSDVLPAGATFVSATNGATYDAGTNTVSFTTGTLAMGDQTSFLLTLAISPSLTGTLSNTATVAAPSGVTDTNPGNNSSTDTDQLTPEADLSITKDDGAATAVPGTNDTYTVTVTNSGPSTVTGATVSDVLPAGTTFVSATNGATYDAGTNTVSFTTSTLASGDMTSLQLPLSFPPRRSADLSNTATVAAPSGVTDTNPG